MILSQKSQYAVRAVFELAKREGSGPVKAAKISAAQSIPARFLENILGQLRQAGIVDSVRGKEGGYLLGKPSSELTVGEVMRLLLGHASGIEEAETDGGRAGDVLVAIWEKANQAMMDVYDGTTFKDLVEQEMVARERETLNYAI
ncbi:MAG: Rrf2 family transcriptional regulator [bacterium]